MYYSSLKNFGGLWYIVIVNDPFQECHCKWHCAKQNQHAKHVMLWNLGKLGAMRLNFVAILIISMYQLTGCPTPKMDALMQI